jgi:hypothetical protein
MEETQKRGKRLLGCLLVGFYVLVFSGMVQAETFCVSNAIELQNALTTAGSNEDDDIIQVQQGAYYGNFVYSSINGDSITLLGGYLSGCADRVAGPSNTILEGIGSGSVLYLHNISGGDIFVEGFTLQNGNASGNGGGIYALSSSASGTAGDVSLQSNIIRENTAYFGGGGISALSLSHTDSAGDITLTDNTITGNTGYPGLGGGVYAYSAGGTDSGDVTLSNNTITENTTEGSGGGVFAVSSGRIRSGNVILTHNTITGNTSIYAGGGGGISVYSSSISGTAGQITVTNKVIAENIAHSGGGVQAYTVGATQSGEVIFTNNTVTGNTADFGGGLYLQVEGNDNNIYNSIIWGNWSEVGGDIGLEWLGPTGTANAYNNDYSDLYGTWTNSDRNIDKDPLFVDPDKGDFHLHVNSPCIDEGTNKAPELPEKDIDSDSRIIEGPHNETATVDIGADEYASQID